MTGVRRHPEPDYRERSPDGSLTLIGKSMDAVLSENEAVLSRAFEAIADVLEQAGARDNVDTLTLSCGRNEHWSLTWVRDRI